MYRIVSQYDMELINKKTTARMPWHDIHTAMVHIIKLFEKKDKTI